MRLHDERKKGCENERRKAHRRDYGKTRSLVALWASRRISRRNTAITGPISRISSTRRFMSMPTRSAIASSTRSIPRTRRNRPKATAGNLSANTSPCWNPAAATAIRNWVELLSVFGMPASLLSGRVGGDFSYRND